MEHNSIIMSDSIDLSRHPNESKSEWNKRLHDEYYERKLNEEEDDDLVHIKLAPTTPLQVHARSIINGLTNGQKCCTICGDTDDLHTIDFSDESTMYFCNICYHIQIDM